MLTQPTAAPPTPAASPSAQHEFCPKRLADIMDPECPNRDAWITAHMKEVNSILNRSTMSEPLAPDAVQLLNPRQILKSKMTYRVSYNPDGSLKLKARFVACGYSQIEGVNYDETYAPTAHYKSLCTLLHIAAVNGYEIQSADVESAFLESPLEEDVFMKISKDFYGEEAIVKLNKSLYGLKQAGECWYKNINGIILSLGFSRLISDICVYRASTASSETLLLVYVDDIIIVGNDATAIKGYLTGIGAQLTHLKELGELQRFVGIDITRNLDHGTIFLSQPSYVVDFISENSTDERVRAIPVPPSLDYSVDPDPETTLPPIHDKVGQIRYLADRTFPQLLIAASIIGSAAANPTENHLKVLRDVTKYLRGAKNLGVTLGGKGPINISDATFKRDGDSKSQYGYTIFLGQDSGAVYSRSIKATTISLSSTEAELKALVECVKEVTWFRQFLSELGYEQFQPTVIGVDNTASIALGESLKNPKNVKHFILTLNYLREENTNGTIKMELVTSSNNVADILTKPLNAESFGKHAMHLLNGGFKI